MTFSLFILINFALVLFTPVWVWTFLNITFNIILIILFYSFIKNVFFQKVLWFFFFLMLRCFLNIRVSGLQQTPLNTRKVPLFFGLFHVRNYWDTQFRCWPQKLFTAIFNYSHDNDNYNNYFVLPVFIDPKWDNKKLNVSNQLAAFLSVFVTQKKKRLSKYFYVFFKVSLSLTDFCVLTF